MITKASQKTPDKFLRRHTYIADALYRAAHYLAEHAESPKVRDAATNFMLPESLIKTLNVAARQYDKAKFYQTLYAPGTRRALSASLRYLLKEPENFLKATVLLTAPRLYFWIRSKSFGGRLT